MARAAWPVALPLLAFGGYAAASTSWSLSADTEQGYKLLGAIIAGLLMASGAARLSRQGLRFAAMASVAGVMVLCAFAMVESQFGMPLNRMAQPDAIDWVLARNPGKGVTVLVILAWAAIAAITVGQAKFGRSVWFFLIALVGYLALQFDQATNFVAFAMASAAALFAVMFSPMVAVRLVFSGAAVWLLAAPLVLPYVADALGPLPFSLEHRLEIWRYASTKALETPLLGLGIDAARTLSQEGVVLGQTVQLMPLHPHSASLQIWLELGGVGAMLGALTLLIGGWFAGAAVKRSKVAGVAVAGSAAAYLTLANLSYGAWQEWLVCTSAVAAVSSLVAVKLATLQADAHSENFDFIVE
jgi:O-antigen ligase